MKTLYSACLSRLGLSQSEAAALHGVRIDTVKSWSSGRNGVPEAVWSELRAVETKIVDGSEELRERWEASGSPPIEIDDSKADGVSLMATADFVLTADSPVLVGRTSATRAARQARRQR